MKYILSLLLVWSFSAHAKEVDFKSIAEAATKKCEKDVEYVLEGRKVPCTGYLFSPAKEYDVRVKIEKYELTKELSERQNEINKVLEERLKNMREYNQGLSKELRDERSNNFWKNTLYFGLGVLVTGAIAVNVR